MGLGTETRRFKPFIGFEVLRECSSVVGWVRVANLGSSGSFRTWSRRAHARVIFPENQLHTLVVFIY